VIVAASLVLVLAGAAIWFGGRTMNRPGNREPASRPASTIGSTTVPHTAPTGAALPLDISNQPAAAGATMSPVSEATDTSAASGPSTGEAFEIVIASFRTAARAADVVADVAALGLPVRRRTAAGWQQVLAGPYASAAQAREAQQHLERAGFKDIQLVSAAR
jgi:cell division protein FtsN